MIAESEPTEAYIKEYLEIKNLLVMGDKIKLSQVIRNMISNALKFTAPGGKVLISADWDKEDKRFVDLEFVQKSNNDTEASLENNEEHANSNSHNMEAGTASASSTTAATNGTGIASLPPPATTTTTTTTTNGRSTLASGVMANDSQVKSEKSKSATQPSRSFFPHFSHSNKDVSKKNLKQVIEHKNVGSVTIKVTDSGAGLSKQNLSQLFQEGVQFNANKLQAGGGSGLGLWISKGIVDLHHGLLSATSPGIGLGCTFIVSEIYF
jgi:signal transduction histidine kinase